VLFARRALIAKAMILARRYKKSRAASDLDGWRKMFQTAYSSGPRFVPLLKPVSQILRIYSDGIAYVEERKGPFVIVLENPFCGRREQAIGFSAMQWRVFLEAFDGVQEDRQHQSLFGLIL
jgi:hypothetical protein